MKLYGKGGRTFRCLWMLEEAGVAYEHELVDWAAGESHTPAYLHINPNGKVPALADGALILCESLAINYHLARHYAKHLWPGIEHADSLGQQWLAWGMGELEGPHDAANRTKTTIDMSRLQVSLAALGRQLTEQAYMLGDHFSVVDLNTACLLLRPQYRPVVETDATLQDWFAACTSRPALRRAMAASLP